jgi:flagellar hook-associated protein 1
MSGISDALNNSANNIGALERSLAIIQENVGNASTPGYARQNPGAPLDSASISNTQQQQSSRDEYSESAVRRQNSLFGHFDQLTSILGLVQSNFGASGDAEIPNAISTLFATFSGLTTDPNATTARQLVLDQATQLGRAFNHAATNLESIKSDTRQQISSEVDTINHLASLVQEFNTSHQNNAAGAADPIVDAKLHATLEQASEFADIQPLQQSDGSITLLLGGQTALVVGENQYKIQADISTGSARILDTNGADITSQISGGRLSGSLAAVNQLIPSYEDGLNQLAKGIADAVNTTLAGGLDSTGAPGAPLYTYGSAATAASTLATTGITAPQIAAASAGAPGGNGNALALSALSSSTLLNGFTFAGFYGNLSAGVGRDVANATDSQGVQRQLLAQTRAQRTASSGVSLDEEAVRLVEFQRAYEATAKLVSVLDQITQETINMLPAA